MADFISTPGRLGAFRRTGRRPRGVLSTARGRVGAARSEIAQEGRWLRVSGRDGSVLQLRSLLVVHGLGSAHLAIIHDESHPLVRHDFFTAGTTVTYGGKAVVHDRRVSWISNRRRHFHPGPMNGHHGQLCELRVGSSNMQLPHACI